MSGGYPGDGDVYVPTQPGESEAASNGEGTAGGKRKREGDSGDWAMVPSFLRNEMTEEETAKLAATMCQEDMDADHVKHFTNAALEELGIKCVWKRVKMMRALYEHFGSVSPKEENGGAAGSADGTDCLAGIAEADRHNFPVRCALSRTPFNFFPPIPPSPRHSPSSKR